MDETPDEEFYRTPRLVTHIDERAIAAVTQLYRELFPAGEEVLDLMSSWISHLPPEVEYGRVVGLGMNETELRRNDRLDAYAVQNLNEDPRLPFGDAEFDACGVCVSIDYLTRPVEVLREVGRVLKPTLRCDHLLHRCFPPRWSPSGTSSTTGATCSWSRTTSAKQATGATCAAWTQPPPHVQRPALRSRRQEHRTLRGRTRSASP
jgi:SAM-dependent methyltransferase